MIVEQPVVIEDLCFDLEVERDLRKLWSWFKKVNDCCANYD